MLTFSVRAAPARIALCLLLLACATLSGVSADVCADKCSGGCPVQCPDGPAGCRSGSSSQYSLNGVGYTCCSTRDVCKSVTAPPATNPPATTPAASPTTPAASPVSTTSTSSATKVTMDFYATAGTCSGAKTAASVTNTIGKNCEGPDADGHYNTVTHDGDTLNIVSYEDSSCTKKWVEVTGCQCDKCCEVTDASGKELSDMMLTCEAAPSTSSASKVSLYLGLFFALAAALVAA